MAHRFLLFLSFVLSISVSDAFVSPSSRKIHKALREPAPKPFNPTSNGVLMNSGVKETSLHMGYNLPPGGGGSRPRDVISNIITPLATIAATVLFFLSPLGSIFFAMTNFIFILLLITPFVAAIAFQGWQYFYTIEAPCPSCGSPARVLKDEEAGPNICLNCGALVRANLDKDGIELCNNPNDIYDENSRVSSFFDLFTNGADNGGSDFSGEERSVDSNRRDKERRERTVIDVDVTRDD